MLELRYGPFWEPAHDRPAIEPDRLIGLGVEFESQLRLLVTGRKKSLVFIALEIAGFVILIAAAALTPQQYATAVMVGFAVLSTVGYFFLIKYWRDWYVLARYGYILPPSPPAPAPMVLVESMRKLCDGFCVVGDGPAVAVLVELRRVAPLAYEACMHTTIVGSALQRNARAA